MNDIDAKLKNRYERAYAIISGIGGTDTLVIQVAKDIKEEEDKQYQATNKSDFGSVGNMEEQKIKDREAKQEAAEEKAWGELDLGIPQEKKVKIETL